MLNAKEIEFSPTEKFDLKGVGSPRIIYQVGIKDFDYVKKESTSLFYINFELCKNGIIIRSNRTNDRRKIFLNYSDIIEFHVLTKRYKVFAYYKWWLKYDGSLNIKMTNTCITCHIPQVYYKPFMKFLNKSWIKEKLNNEIDPSPPETLKFGSILGFFHI